MSFIEKVTAILSGIPKIESESEAKKSNINLITKIKNKRKVIENEKNQKYLFTTDEDGVLKQWDIEEKKLIKEYGEIHSSQINSQSAKIDGQYFITSDVDGFLKQWDIEQQNLIKDYGEINSSQIKSQSAKNDAQYIITSDVDGYLKQLDIEQQNLIKDYGEINSGQTKSKRTKNDG